MIALILLTFGIYDALSSSIAQRIRDVDARRASDPHQHNIFTTAVRHGMRFAVPGVVIGLCIAVAINHILTTLLFGISQLDPVTYLGSITMILVVPASACLLPVWRTTGSAR